MPYFLDSNVIAGYIFYNTDHWGNAAVRVFDDQEPNHSGSSVRRECFGEGGYDSGRIRTIRREVASVLRQIIFHIKKGKTLDQAVTVVESDRIGEIIGGVRTIITVSPGRPVEGILRTCLNDFEGEVVQRVSIVEKQCIWHRCTSPYREIYNTLTSCISDRDDIEVVIDAHDAAQSVSDLVLVTGDYRHLVPNIGEILTHTAISDVKPLGSFT